MVKISSIRLIPEGDFVKLAADVAYDGNVRTMWYEAPKQYADYLTFERADCFLVALLPSIAKRGGRVTIDAPVSSHLLFKLREVLSPLLPLVSPAWAPLQIEAEAAGPLDVRKPRGVGASCSCGVDSLFTIQRYTGAHVPEDWKLTHLLYLKAGAHRHNHLGDASASREDYLAAGRLANAAAFAEHIGLPLIAMKTNLGDFFDGYTHESIHSFLSMSCVLSMQKLFGVYYFSSGVHAREDAFDPEDSARYDSKLVECLSTENTVFYSDGYEQTRYGKTRVIADYAPARDYLNVCIYEIDNCTRCPKCLRTITQLEMLGKLSLFRRVFDLEFYKKHRIQFLGEGIYKSGYFLQEMLQALPGSCISDEDKKKIYRDFRKRQLFESAWLLPFARLARKMRHFFCGRQG